MSKPSIQELRKRLKERNEKKGGSNFTSNNDVYPHWNIDVDTTATVRILPDKNEDNENAFYVDKLEHKLSVAGKDRKISCLQMYGEKCPICDISAKYYKNNDKVQGKYYYRKKTALLKALILKDPITKDGHESAVGQVKTLQFTYQLMQQINQQVANDEEETALTCVPWDLEEGHNFFIKKTKQGDYDNYTTGSGFAHKVTGIADEYLDAVNEGMVDLTTLLPPNPGLEKVQALLEAHLTGEELEEEETSSAPKRRVAESTDDEDVVPRRKRPVEADDEEEIPVRKPKRPAVEDDEEEVPVRKPKRPVVEEEEEEVPVRKPAKKPVVVEDEEEEEEESAVMRRIRARKRGDES